MRILTQIRHYLKARTTPMSRFGWCAWTMFGLFQVVHWFCVYPDQHWFWLTCAACALLRPWLGHPIPEADVERGSYFERGND